MNYSLRLLRNEKKMTQEELAEQMEVSRQTVAKWENRESIPDIAKCRKLANIFGLSLDEIASIFIVSDEPYKKSVKQANKVFFGIDTIEGNRVTLPENAMSRLGIKNGDEVIILGDSSQGLILTPKFNFTDPTSITEDENRT